MTTQTAALNAEAHRIREAASECRAVAESYSGPDCTDPMLLAMNEQAIYHASRAQDRCRSNPDLAKAHLQLAEEAIARVLEAQQ